MCKFDRGKMVNYGEFERVINKEVEEIKRGFEEMERGLS